jgi:hypothetical protein
MNTITVKQAEQLGVKLIETDEVNENGGINFFCWRVNNGMPPYGYFEIEYCTEEYGDDVAYLKPEGLYWGFDVISCIKYWRPHLPSLIKQIEQLQNDSIPKTSCNQSGDVLEQKIYHYTKCDFKHSWKAVRAFEEGIELFIDDKGTKPVDEGKHFYCDWFDKLYTREEISYLEEVKNELQEFLTNNTFISEDWNFSDFLGETTTVDSCDKAFIDACCIVAKLKDKI